MKLQKYLVNQFHHPSGLMGFFAGQIMATRQSNLDRNLWTVRLLDLAPEDRVLELGPGPGKTLRHLLERASNGSVVGVDHSEMMLKKSRRHNKIAFDTNRLSLVKADFRSLPKLPGPFDKIIAVNALQFDGMTRKVLGDITQYLTDEGIFAITFQPRGKNPSDEQALAFANKIVRLLKEVGLTQTRIEKLPMAPACAICVLASKYQSALITA